MKGEDNSNEQEAEKTGGYSFEPSAEEVLEELRRFSDEALLYEQHIELVRFYNKWNEIEEDKKEKNDTNRDD